MEMDHIPKYPPLQFIFKDIIKLLAFFYFAVPL